MTIRRTNVGRFGAVNGGSSEGLTISYSTQPTAQTSARCPLLLVVSPRKTSGAMYSGVPATAN